MRALVVHGDPGVQRRLRSRLRRSGWAVEAVRKLRDAEQHVFRVSYDVVLVSRVLADGDGLILLRRVTPETGLVVVGREGGTEERAEVLAAGADECLDPTVGVEELVARVAKVSLRRLGAGSEPVRLGRLTFDPLRRVVAVDGEPRHLSPTQLCLFTHLMIFHHRVVGAEELAERCWPGGRGLSGDPLRTQIHRLRAALSDVVIIRWIDGGGYLVEPVAEDDVGRAG